MAAFGHSAPSDGEEAAPSASATGSGAVYYSDGRPVELEASRRHVAVRLTGWASGPEVDYLEGLLGAVESRDLPAQGLRIYTLSEGRARHELAGLLDELGASPAVELVAPVFDAPGALMIVADQFLASLAPGVDERQLALLGRRHGAQVVRRASWDERTFVLRVARGDALDVANAFHLSPVTSWAHPDFVRVLDRAPSPGRERRGELVLGPDGRAVAPGFRPTKGTKDYRVKGRARFEAPPEALRVASSSGADATATPQGNVSQSLIQMQNFEASFPSVWYLSGEPTWDDVRYRRSKGQWSGYGVGTGVSPPGPYPKQANAWMIYGPFDLTDAVEVRVNLDAWVRTESFVDVLFVGASTNSTNYSGIVMSGDWAATTGGNGFMNVSVDLARDSGLDFSVSNSVWLGIAFISDSSVQFEGAYIDEVRLEKITGGLESVTNDVHDPLQWSLSNNRQSWGTTGADIHATEAWGITEGSDLITVAVIDDGVDLSHPDLGGKLAQGYDATGGGSGGAPTGDEALGTSSAGVTAAITDNGIGVAGIAKQARILPVRVVSGGVTQDSWLADGIEWATANGADILSNGWSGGGPSTAVSDAIRDAHDLGRGGLGALVVFGSGDTNGSVLYPATLDQTLAVGALSPCDERSSPVSCDGEYWWGGSFGGALDLSAPGVDAYTTDLVGSAGVDPSDYYHGFGGTRAAAAVVSGAAALVLAWDPGLDVSSLEARLTSTADDLGPKGFDNQTGHGRVNAYEALLATTPSALLTIDPLGSGTGTVSSVPGGISCGTNCVSGFAFGSVVTLSAVPQTGSTFEGWGGDPDCADGVVTLDTAKTCTATFKVLPTFILRVLKAGAGTGTVESLQSGISCGPTCLAGWFQGTVIDLAGYPDPGFQFDGWSGEADCLDGSVTMTGPLTCTATFSPCAGTSQLIVPAQTINTPVVFEACNSIEVGTGTTIDVGGDVTFQAGNSVSFDNGFSVESGGELAVLTGVPSGQ